MDLAATLKLAALAVEAAILGCNWLYALPAADSTESPVVPCLHGTKHDPGDDRADAAVLPARDLLLQHQARIYKSDDRIGTDQRRDDRNRPVARGDDQPEAATGCHPHRHE